MEVTRNDFSQMHHFASTHPLNELEAAQQGIQERPEAYPQWLQEQLYRFPSAQWERWWRLLRPGLSLVLSSPILAGILLAWWHGAALHGVTVALLLLGNVAQVWGLTLLHEYHDYRQACRNDGVKYYRGIYATGYHLLAARAVEPQQVIWLVRRLLVLSVLCTIGLLLLSGWLVVLFYSASLLLMYMYSAPAARYGYLGWGIGELGLLLSYSVLPLVNSYYVTSQTLNWNPVFVSIPFGLMVILLFANYNFIHHRRDWLMRKRTLVVTCEPQRALDINSILTVLVYAALLCLVSLAQLPMVMLVTLAPLPLAIRIYGQLRREVLGLEECFLLYRSTVVASLWTVLLFVCAFVINTLF